MTLQKEIQKQSTLPIKIANTKQMKKKSANRKQQKLSRTKTETIPKPQEEQMLKGNDFQLELYTSFIVSKIGIGKRFRLAYFQKKKIYLPYCLIQETKESISFKIRE